ncbi:NAD-dependent epimerase/dehydratase family protein [Deinococcus sp. HMF7620]|uniref:NAD-dependent epimerase/dehydratase family protein n=1 Tax=Deinococcus arboris TaxID=2682977 RepID=A0A7C9HRZ2_9DEIO|nr:MULTISPECIES: UDP-glucuronic acid decarboxylase family protein [Deinococcus]MBZ9749799.1 SDR family oxidoreductase [Deinococcus betulae]MVN87147.1 NAD-dependent epimerase/dehydratase family protein [Deinococcus arboris]
MRLLLTGSAGFIGSHLAASLLTSGAQVIGVDNYLSGQPAHTEALKRHPGFTFFEADVSQGLPLVAGPLDWVLHFASPASPPHYQQFPVETLMVGAQGTQHALNLARRQGARFLLASTSEVYGDPLVHPQPETYWGHVNPNGLRSCYDEAKRYAEAITMAYHRAHGLDTRIVRIFNTYGPHMRADDGRVVTNFIHQALAGEALTVQGDGQQTRSFQYVSDLIRGVRRLMDVTYHGPVNLGGTDAITMQRFAEVVRAAINPGLPIRFVPLAADDPRQRQPDITLARTLLGWAPEVSLDEGLKRTIASFRQQASPAGPLPAADLPLHHPAT